MKPSRGVVCPCCREHHCGIGPDPMAFLVISLEHLGGSSASSHFKFCLLLIPEDEIFLKITVF